MNEFKRILLLDCDGVIINGEPLERKLHDINPKASKFYRRPIDAEYNKLEEQLKAKEIAGFSGSPEYREIELRIRENRKKRAIHHDIRDRVIEEVGIYQKKKINYTDIYRIENALPGVIDRIKAMWKSGIYSQIYVVTHCNTEEEIVAKSEFFSRYLPFVEVIFVKVHLEPYNNGKCNITNKIEEFKRVTGITDLSMATFIDDTKAIIDDGRNSGVDKCFFKPEYVESIKVFNQAFVSDWYDYVKMIQQTRYNQGIKKRNTCNAPKLVKERPFINKNGVH